MADLPSAEKLVHNVQLGRQLADWRRAWTVPSICWTVTPAGLFCEPLGQNREKRRGLNGHTYLEVLLKVIIIRLGR